MTRRYDIVAAHARTTSVKKSSQMLRSTLRNLFLGVGCCGGGGGGGGGILELPSLSLSRCSSRAAVVFLNGCATFGYCGFKFFLGSFTLAMSSLASSVTLSSISLSLSSLYFYWLTVL